MSRGHVTCITANGATVSAALDELLSTTQREAVRDDANAWIKRLRRVPFDHASMRERFTYRGDSLWWFTELYLHKMRRLDSAVATVRALEAARERHEPASLDIATTDATVRRAADAFAAATGIRVTFSGPAPEPRTRSWNGLLVGVTAHLSRLRPTRRHPIVRENARVAAFVHTAFWKADARTGADQEHYIGAVLASLATADGADALTCVGVGPRRHFRARRWWDPLTDAGADPRVIPIESLAPRARLTGALDVWRGRHELARAIVSGSSIREAGYFGAYDLWPILRHELEEVARVQWPWSVRAMDEAGAALDALQPRVAITYAEAGGWGRAMVLEARRRGIPSVGIQHGFIYRHWLNYRHEADEMASLGSDAGFPKPTLTLVFDGYAAEYLQRAGHFPAQSLRVTGSPRLDELAARVRALAPDRARLRRELGVADEASLLVLAAKFSEIEDDLRALFDAVIAHGGTRLIVKPHPAETAEGYLRFAQDAPAIHVADGSADLGRLLAAADGLVTRNSTVALDALVLGIPALVVGLPNNLSPFVDAGVMLGATRETIHAELRTLLYDRDARDALRQRGAAYAAASRMSADGRAADRAAEAILQLARGVSAPPSKD